jgi:double-stranded uracil-DNA glycosylase
MRPTMSSADRQTTAAERPSKSDLAAANGRAIPDVIAPSLSVVFCGINPGLWSAATGRHFARPGNRFWPALHSSGFTPRRFQPTEQCELLSLGLGITNVVDRASARAEELSLTELREGGDALMRKVRRLGPRWLAVLGVGAYRAAFSRRDAIVGLQPDLIGSTQIWVLPNPSGLNAHYPMDRLVTEFATLRKSVDADSSLANASGGDLRVHHGDVIGQA